jgi:purine-nucleoside phosphorylase
MESATLFALAARRDLVAASLLVVSDLLADERRRIDAAALEKAELRMGEVALAALAHAE